jgi:hypothetical protein
MKSLVVHIMSVFVVLTSVQSFAQDSNSWGDTFACSVDWFAACTTTRVELAVDSEKPKEKPARTVVSPSFLQQSAHQPAPVRNVLDNPSPETARAYVTWSRQANEKLARAAEYIAQATRELNTESGAKISIGKSGAIAASGLGPVGLYYFFSPDDQTALKDVRVLNKIFQGGRLGVVGIPVRGRDEEIVQFLNETKPLFPVRKSEAEVRMIKPSETPELHLALPLEKKIFRIGSVLNETVITHAIEDILVAVLGRKSSLSPLTSAAADRP